ncbi:hypothetical protein L3V83_13540 [Thiotrichales bacterium 19X7-9]|nr:hypothetical protein [Thiotrichales bacterium 19X7-9]MCF6777587.1 hypothetical protein [Thiotrichales bacterium 19X7-9]
MSDFKFDINSEIKSFKVHLVDKAIDYLIANNAKNEVMQLANAIERFSVEGELAISVLISLIGHFTKTNLNELSYAE